MTVGILDCRTQTFNYDPFLGFSDGMEILCPFDMARALTVDLET